METVDEKWGIDLRGRTMVYAPWPINHRGEYRSPSEEEIRKVYGVSGEAVEETLRYFEECGGDTDALVRLLNEHAVDDRFVIDRDSLLARHRWYTNEYYFYFIMFTKSVMNDYSWYFTIGGNVQLSKYHKIYEKGFLEYVPYGENEGDVTNSIFYSAIDHYAAAGYDFTDFFAWTDSLTRYTTDLNYKNDVSNLDSYWLCGEFMAFLISFLMVIVNKNDVPELVHDCFDSYALQGFSYIPESMLDKAITLFIKKSSSLYDVEMKYRNKHSIDFSLRVVAGRFLRSGIYEASNYHITYLLISAAFQEIIKKLLKLNELPLVKDFKGLHSSICSFTIQWKKGIPSFPYLLLFVANLSALALLILNQFFQRGMAAPIILFFLPLNVILILIRRLHIELQRRKILDEHIEKNIEDKVKGLAKTEELSQELMREKKILEQKVKDRTAELARANEKLKELYKAKTDFFANISHELRTPLTLLLGPIESIQAGEYGRLLSKDNRVFSMMHFNGSKLLKLINNLLDITKIEAHKLTINKKKTDIAGLVRFYASMIKPYVEGRGISIAFNNNAISPADPDGSIVAWVDRDLLEKAIFNLLSNAVKFTPGGGAIILQVDKNDDSFAVSVKDSGLGIPNDKLEAIFERFVQLDGSSSRKYEGTGIGLALTKEIIDALGGRVTVASKPGEGSVFTLILPCGDPENVDAGKETIEAPTVKNAYMAAEFAQHPQPTSSEKRIGKHERGDDPDKKKILIVEDASDMQVFLGSLLEKEYTVILAGNGEEGLLKAEQDQPDLILLDVMMPGMDGYEMTRRIKARMDLNGIPVVLLTAKADFSMKLTGFEKGADDYIVKPFNTLELRARIKALLEMKALRDRIVRQRDKVRQQQQRLRAALKQKETAWRQLKIREKRFHEMAEHLPTVIVETDQESKITYLNKIGRALLELTPREVSGRPSFIDFIDPEDKERFRRDQKAIQRQSLSTLYEYRFTSKRHNTFFGLFKSASLQNEESGPALRAIITEVRHYLDLMLMPEDHFYKKYRISPREKEVLEFILKGYRNKEIGEKLFISERTVKKHMANILEKTDCARRRDLITFVRESEKSRQI
jgi:PAS domain S-box-containing protein